jgi:hypothetical protein
MSARWSFNFDGGTAFVAGPKAEARRRLHVCGDKSPTWIKRLDGWAISPATARTVLHQLHARWIANTVEDTAQSVLDLTVDLTLDFPAPGEPEPTPQWRGIRYGGLSS